MAFKHLFRGVLALCLVALPIGAQDDVAEPPLPQPRPADLDAPQEDAAPETGTEETEAEEGMEDETESAEEQDAAEDDAGEPVPERIYQSACPAMLSGRVIAEMAPPLSEGACGLESPIAVSAIMVNGREIILPGQPVTSCAMATALADWAEEVDAYAGAALDTRVAELSTGPGYVCRLRNNQDTGFVSEHGRANAIDISAIGLADGTAISVLEDWSAAGTGEEAKFLGFAHSAACGRFTTVLGPDANAEHEDHFHFDLGCHGQSCTAQICE